MVQEVAPGKHSQRRKSKGEIGTGEAPWQPLWAMLATWSLFPSLNKSIKSNPHFLRSVELSPPFLIRFFLWYLSEPQLLRRKNEGNNGDDT